MVSSFQQCLLAEPNLSRQREYTFSSLFVFKEIHPIIFWNPFFRHPLSFYCPELYYTTNLKHWEGEWNYLCLFGGGGNQESPMGLRLD